VQRTAGNCAIPVTVVLSVPGTGTDASARIRIARAV
jgi:hypothetical protein